MMMQMIHRKLERIRKENKKVFDVLVGMVYTQRNLLNDKREIQLSQYSRRSIIKNVKDFKIVSYSAYVYLNLIELKLGKKVELKTKKTIQRFLSKT